MNKFRRVKKGLGSGGFTLLSLLDPSTNSGGLACPQPVVIFFILLRSKGLLGHRRLDKSKPLIDSLSEEA